MRATLDAIRHLEAAVTGADWTEGIVLRYGGFYGPGTVARRPGGEQVEAIRRRKFPVVGDGAGVWSFVHIDDAADGDGGGGRARRAAASTTSSTTSPAPVARVAAGARARRSARKPPRRVPRWLGRLLAGEAAAVMMTEVRGASNAKAKRELGWQPAPSELAPGLAASAA